jgi:MFS family permease
MEPWQDDPVVHAAPVAAPGLPDAALRRNGPFVTVWAASTISIFGSLVTRIALPFAAIEVLGAGSIEIGVLRASELLGALAVGFVAGAWVDRLRRRPVLIWSDLGRAALLGSVPIAALGGWLSLPHVLLVSFAAAILTTFFDAADKAYLPTIVTRDQLVRANGTLVATGSAAEFGAFGIAGFLVQAFTAPIAILVDAVSFIVSATLLATIRRREPPPPPVEAREPLLDEIRAGLGIVLHDPVLRALAVAAMSVASLWGVFGATWLLFITRDLALDPATVGLVASLGGLGSAAGALVVGRLVARWGIGRVTIGGLGLAALGNLFIPLAPAGQPVVAVVFLLVQQLIGDTAITAYDIAELSARQARVADHELGRVNATVRVGMVAAQLVATLVAGVLATWIGLRATSFLAPIGPAVGMLVLWWSPVRSLRGVDDRR